LRPDFHAWVSILVGCKLKFDLRHFEFLVRHFEFGFLLRRLRFNFLVRFVGSRVFVGHFGYNLVIGIVRHEFFVRYLGFLIWRDECFGERRSICER
jgi:hypothetical protein